MRNFFRETGIGSSMLHSSTSGSFDFIAPPGAGKRVVIVDVSSDIASSFKSVTSANYVDPGANNTTNASAGGSDIVLHVGPGGKSFLAPLKLGDNLGLMNDSNAKVTVTYYIED